MSGTGQARRGDFRSRISSIVKHRRWGASLVKERTDYIVYASIATYAIIFSYFAILRHYAFETRAWDFGIFEQSFWTTVKNGRLFYSTPGLHFNPSGIAFGGHFSPIFFLVLPIYAAFSTPETLLVVKTVVLALGALPLYWLARDELGGRRSVGLAIALAYLLYTPLHGLNWYEFQSQAFIPLPYLFAFYYFRRHRLLRSLAFLMLTLSTIEFASILCVCFGIYGLITSFTEHRRSRGVDNDRRLIVYSLFVIVLSSAWYLVALRVMESVNPGGLTMAPGMRAWSHWGESSKEVVLNVSTRPFEAARYILNSPEKANYLIWILSPVLFIPMLRAPLELLLLTSPWPAIALLASPLFSHFYGDAQYPGFFVAQVFIATVCGLRLFSPRNAARSVGLLLVVSLISSVVISPVGFGLYERWAAEGKPEIKPHHAILNEVLRLVPPDATVVTQDHIFPHICHGSNVHPNPVSNAEYILTDGYSSQRWFTPGLVTPKGWISPVLASADEYGVFAAVDGVVLLKKGYKGPVIRPVELDRGLIMKVYNGTEPRGEPVVEMVKREPSWHLGLWPPCPIVGVPERGSALIERYVDFWCITYEGFLYVPETGSYAFSIKSDDESSLFIDGNLVMEGGTAMKSTTVWLERGHHEIRIKWVQWTFEAYFELQWWPPWAESYESLAKYLHPTVS